MHIYKKNLNHARYVLKMIYCNHYALAPILKASDFETKFTCWSQALVVRKGALLIQYFFYKKINLFILPKDFKLKFHLLDGNDLFVTEDLIKINKQDNGIWWDKFDKIIEEAYEICKPTEKKLMIIKMEKSKGHADDLSLARKYLEE